METVPNDIMKKIFKMCLITRYSDLELTPSKYSYRPIACEILHHLKFLIDSKTLNDEHQSDFGVWSYTAFRYQNAYIIGWNESLKWLKRHNLNIEDLIEVCEIYMSNALPDYYTPYMNYDSNINRIYYTPLIKKTSYRYTSLINDFLYIYSKILLINLNPSNLEELRKTYIAYEDTINYHNKKYHNKKYHNKKYHNKK